MNYQIVDSQLYGNYDDEPPLEYITESLEQIGDTLSNEDTWFCKGNYQLNFWLDTDDKDLIYCNAFVLKNPDDFSDSSTENYSYYYEIKRYV